MSWPIDLASPALLYIAQEISLLVGYNVRVLVKLQGNNVTRITCGEFLVGLDLLPFLWGTRGLCPTPPDRVGGLWDHHVQSQLVECHTVNRQLCPLCGHSPRGRRQRRKGRSRVESKSFGTKGEDLWRKGR